MTEVFVEQPLALPGAANHDIYSRSPPSLLICVIFFKKFHNFSLVLWCSFALVTQSANIKNSGFVILKFGEERKQ